MESILTSNYTPYQKFRIELVREKPIQEVTIKNAQDVFDTMHDEASRLDRECFWVLCLDAGNKVIGVNLVSMGTLNSSLVHAREVFKPALLVGSNSVILVHNHPSGNLKVSTEDISITHTLKGAGDILGVKVLDHIIIADTGFVSLKEMGYLQ